jgi:ABC-type glutathione transport system ATPase component
MLIGMLRSSEGQVLIRMGAEWREVASLDAAQEAAFRRGVQMVYQESDLALDPMLPALESVQEGYQVNWPGLPRHEAKRCSMRLLHELGLRPRQWRSLPGILSGGERKRAVIARAFAALGYGLGQPPDSLPGRMLIADEPTAGLDCATQALLLSFFRKQQVEMDLAFVLISHDLAMVRAFSDRVLVMFGGRAVERGASRDFWPADGTANFMHPYSRELASETSPDGDWTEHPAPPAAGCIFRAECPFAETPCQEPQPWQGTPDHQWACWKAEKIV